MSPPSELRTRAPVERARLAVAALYAFTLIGLAGYAVVVAAPRLGAWLPDRALLLDYGPIIFARGQILVSFCVLALLLGEWRGWAGGCVAVVLLGFAAEFVGVRTGLPFGRYHFTDLLGPKILATVPLLMPLAWYNISLPAHVIATAVFPQATLRRCLLGSWLMLAWDLSIDPCLGHLYSFWVWDSPGVYYGIPFSNFAGWYAVGILAMAVLDRSPRPATPSRLLIPYYGANLAMPMGLAVLSGMWLAPAFTAAAVILGLLLRASGQFRSTEAAPVAIWGSLTRAAAESVRISAKVSAFPGFPRGRDRS
jgi:uncharacterized membrane protein